MTLSWILKEDFKDTTVATSDSVQLFIILYQNCTKAQGSAVGASLTVAHSNTHTCLIHSSFHLQAFIQAPYHQNLRCLFWSRGSNIRLFCLFEACHLEVISKKQTPGAINWLTYVGTAYLYSCKMKSTCFGTMWVYKQCSVTLKVAIRHEICFFSGALTASFENLASRGHCHDTSRCNARMFGLWLTGCNQTDGKKRNHHRMWKEVHSK